MLRHGVPQLHICKKLRLQRPCPAAITHAALRLTQKTTKEIVHGYLGFGSPKPFYI